MANLAKELAGAVAAGAAKAQGVLKDAQGNVLPALTVADIYPLIQAGQAGYQQLLGYINQLMQTNATLTAGLTTVTNAQGTDHTALQVAQAQNTQLAASITANGAADALLAARVTASESAQTATDAKATAAQTKADLATAKAALAQAKADANQVTADADRAAAQQNVATLTTAVSTAKATADQAKADAAAAKSLADADATAAAGAKTTADLAQANATAAQTALTALTARVTATEASAAALATRATNDEALITAAQAKADAAKTAADAAQATANAAQTALTGLKKELATRARTIRFLNVSSGSTLADLHVDANGVLMDYLGYPLGKIIGATAEVVTGNTLNTVITVKAGATTVLTSGSITPALAVVGTALNLLGIATTTAANVPSGQALTASSNNGGTFNLTLIILPIQ